MSRTTSPLRISSDPGVIRGLRRVLSDDGFVEILAVDHGSDIAVLLSDDPSTVTFEDMARAKDLVIRAAAPEVSAILVDPTYGGHLLASGAIPSRTGLVVGLEDEDYNVPPGARNTRLRAGWSVRQLRNLGVDMAKLLWWFRPDAPTADTQRELLADLCAQAKAASVPFVVEPIWYPLVDENTASPEWKAGRVRGIIESAVEIDRQGVDLLKLEFPGSVDTAEGRAAAADAVQELTDRVTAPWTILSAGVDYDAFLTQVEIAAAGGASGYLAGRSIWRDPLRAAPEQRAEASKVVRERFARLNAAISASGRPIHPERALETSIDELGQDWYRA